MAGEEEMKAPSSPEIALEQPLITSFEASEQDEEEIYRQRKRRVFLEEDENALEAFSIEEKGGAETPREANSQSEEAETPPIGP